MNDNEKKKVTKINFHPGKEPHNASFVRKAVWTPHGDSRQENKQKPPASHLDRLQKVREKIASFGDSQSQYNSIVQSAPDHMSTDFTLNDLIHNKNKQNQANQSPLYPSDTLKIKKEQAQGTSDSSVRETTINSATMEESLKENTVIKNHNRAGFGNDFRKTPPSYRSIIEDAEKKQSNNFSLFQDKKNTAPTVTASGAYAQPYAAHPTSYTAPHFSKDYKDTTNSTPLMKIHPKNTEVAKQNILLQKENIIKENIAKESITKENILKKKLDLIRGVQSKKSTYADLIHQSENTHAHQSYSLFDKKQAPSFSTEDDATESPQQKHSVFHRKFSSEQKTPSFLARAYDQKTPQRAGGFQPRPYHNNASHAPYSGHGHFGNSPYSEGKSESSNQSFSRISEGIRPASTQESFYKNESKNTIITSRRSFERKPNAGESNFSGHTSSYNQGSGYGTQSSPQVSPYSQRPRATQSSFSGGLGTPGSFSSSNNRNFENRRSEFSSDRAQGPNIFTKGPHQSSYQGNSGYGSSFQGGYNNSNLSKNRPNQPNNNTAMAFKGKAKQKLAQLDAALMSTLFQTKERSHHTSAILKKKTETTPESRTTDQRAMGKRNKRTIFNSMAIYDTEVLSDDQILTEETQEKTASSHKMFRHNKTRDKRQTKQNLNFPKTIHIGPNISVDNLALILKKKSEFLRNFFAKEDFFIPDNGFLEGDAVQIVLEKFGVEVCREQTVQEKINHQITQWRQKTQSSFERRPPIVAIMGHVNHGKTTLLDWLAKTSVAAKEAGQITQNITSYYVSLEENMISNQGDDSIKAVCFVDTPGHASFAKTRQRGSDIADMVLLLISMTDGIQAQTIEAIKIILQQKKPVIVVYTKADQVALHDQESVKKRIAHSLLQHEIIVESLSGSSPEVMISAATKIGMKELLETISLYSSFLENLKCAHTGLISGRVLEVLNDTEQWIALIITEGQLKIGDTLLIDNEVAKVKNMKTFHGTVQKIGKTGSPLLILGFKDKISIGASIYGVPDVKQGHYILDLQEKADQERKDKMLFTEQSTKTFREIHQENKTKNTQWFLKNFKNMNSKVKDFTLMVKAHTLGFMQDLVDELARIRMGDPKNQEITVSVQEANIEPLTQAEIEMCGENNIFLILFEQKLSKTTQQELEKNKVKHQSYNLIHKVLSDVRQRLYDLLPDIIEEEIEGRGVIVQVFETSSHGSIAGCAVEEGIFKQGMLARVMRKGTVIGEGTIKTMRQNTSNIEAAQKGIKVGLALKDYHGDYEVNDAVHVVKKITKRPERQDR